MEKQVFLKRFIACVMVAFMLLASVPVSGLVLNVNAETICEDIVSSGDCGDSAHWILYSNDVLKIYGSGDIYNYEWGESPFEDWSIKSIIISMDITSIGNHAFNDCSSLTSIIIPNSVTSIGEYAFHDCSSLTSITIPDSVTSIGESAFFNCASLNSVVFGRGITNIGEYAFFCCSSMTNVIIPDSVTRIGANAFLGCDSLKSITIPDSVTSIGEKAFFECDSLASIDVSSGNKNYSSDEYGVLFNKDKTELIQYPNDNDRLSYQIPYSVTSIGTSAFNCCANLTKIGIPNSVKSIGDDAFRSCEGLTSVIIPNSVTNIGKGAFNSCRKLTSVTISDSITSIEGGVFCYCESLKEIIIPNSVTIIGVSAFRYCENLTSVTISSNTTTIEEYAFYDCIRLTNITIPESVTSIGAFCMAGCENLTSIRIPGSVTNIGAFAFSHCNNLTSIRIPDSITSIAVGTFEGCNNLTNIAIPESTTSIEAMAFENCVNLTSIIIPDSVTNILEYAFDNCSNLRDIFYNGNEQQWKQIEIGLDNEPLINATIHYNHTHNPSTAVKENQVASTCAKEGSYDEVFYCSVCKTEISRVKKTVEKAAHKAVTDKAVAATCGKNGKTAGSHCSVCGKVIKAQTVIKATGKHTFTAWKVTKKATYTATGTKARTCTVCGKAETQSIAKLKTTAITKCITKLSITSAAYTGKALKPSVTVKNDKTTLKAGTHYTVTYKNNTKIGKATVTITGIAKNGYTGTKTLTFNIIPANVKNLKATQTTTSVTLSWNKVAGAKGYRVYKYDTKTKKWVKVADTTKTKLTIKKLKAGTSYKYAVKAYTTVSKTTYWSASYAQLSTATKPATPTLKATAGKKQAALSWKKVSGANGYVVYMATGKNGSFKKVATIKKGSTVKYTKKSLKKGTTYRFKIMAYKTVSGKNIYSGYSAVKTVKVK